MGAQKRCLAELGVVVVMEGFLEEVTRTEFQRMGERWGWGRGRHFRWNGEDVQTDLELKRLVEIYYRMQVQCVCVCVFGGT